MRSQVVIGGALAHKPGYGGHTWALLQYALGFRALGWDVLLLDHINASRCLDASGAPCAPRDSVNVRCTFEALTAFGLADRYAVAVDGDWIGLSRTAVAEAIAQSTFVLNIMGFLPHELLAPAQLRVFLDIDPGFGQMWKALGLHDAFAHHDRYVTIGERIGQDDCEIPTCGHEWITTPQPIALEYWPDTTGGNGTFSSVASWRGAYDPIEYRGKRYGLRAHEFRKFADLPRRSGGSFELALDIHAAETADLDRLAAGGWTLLNPAQVAGDPWRYRDFIQASGAEFMVAKNMYVEARSGWLSDRSLCYMASGKPVLAQDTGWTEQYPSAFGLVAFSTPEEAEAGVSRIRGEYARHARAARNLAEEHFDSNKVLSRLLARL